MELESVSTLADLISGKGLAAILALAIIGIVLLVKKIFVMQENTKSELQNKIEILKDEISVLKADVAANKESYTMKLEAITREMTETIKKNTEIIAQNNEIIKNFIQWREK